jgi:hypothetical protein
VKGAIVVASAGNAINSINSRDVEAMHVSNLDFFIFPLEDTYVSLVLLTVTHKKAKNRHHPTILLKPDSEKLIN